MGELNCQSRGCTWLLWATLALAACGRTAPYALNIASGAGGVAPGGGVWKDGPARWLVFDSFRAGNRDLYALSVDTGRLVRLTTDAASDLEPELSPDGTQIAFTSDRGGTKRVWIMLRSGGAPVLLTSRLASQPSWSHDGTRVTFHSGTAIFVIDAAGGNEHQIIAGPDDVFAYARPIFSLEDTALIADSNHQIDEISLATGARRVIVEYTTTTVRVQAPSLSPDGTRIAFDLTCDTTRGGIWIAPVSASNRPCLDGTRLTPTEAPWSARPAFGPDGYIAFEQGEPGDAGQEAQLVVQQVGKPARFLTSTGDNRNPKWAPASVEF